MGASVTHKPSRNNGVISSRCINPFHPCSIFLLKLKVLIEGMLLVNQIVYLEAEHYTMNECIKGVQVRDYQPSFKS